MANLEQVHKGNPSRPVVVFIHGLNGHKFGTWVGDARSVDDCWPHWVGQDSDCDTWVLGYDAAISRWQDQAMSLIDEAVHLAYKLGTHPSIIGRDMILIGHSMGGLIIKKMVVQGLAIDDQVVRSIDQRVRGIVFIATPHFGAELASLLQVLAQLTRPNPQIESLRKDDGPLLELNRQFRVQQKLLSISVLAFAERRAVEFKTKNWIPFLQKVLQIRIVSDSSGDPGVDGAMAVPLPEDHFSIAKPSSRDAVLYRTVELFINQLCLNLTDLKSKNKSISPTLPKMVDGLSRETEQVLFLDQESARAICPTARINESTDKRLQPANSRFYGREELVAQVLSFLQQVHDGVTLVESVQEVVGTGGIGKTEVCKAALKAWLISDPHAVLWYLSLPDDANVANVLELVRRSLGLQDSINTIEEFLQVLPKGTYYLDNSESLLEATDGISLLKAWTELQSIRVLTSSRVSLPSVFGRPVKIDRLPDKAAFRLFRESWAGYRHDLPVDEILGSFVLKTLGAHPLSIVLCGRLGDWCNYTELVRRWDEYGIQTASHPLHPTPRLSSLETSLTLTAKALVQKEPVAVHLWTACALFQGGIDHESLTEIEKRGKWDSARSLLVRHHILSRGSNGDWEMLPPVARFSIDSAIKQHSGFSWSEMCEPVVAMFNERVTTVQASRSSVSALSARRWLIRHFDTLAKLMYYEMASLTPDRNWLRTIAMGLRNEFQFSAVIAKPLLETLLVSLGEDGSLLHVLGTLESRRGETDATRLFFERSLKKCEIDGDAIGQANALKGLADLEYKLGELPNALQFYERALALYKQLKPGIGLANLLLKLGELEARLDQDAKSRNYFQSALEIYKNEHDVLGQANALKAQGDLEWWLRQVGKARVLYEQVLVIYEMEGGSLGQANTLKSLGDLEKREGAIGKAHDFYERALSVFEEDGNGLGQANTVRAQGDLESEFGDIKKADALYEKAQKIYEKQKNRIGQANTFRARGHLLQRAKNSSGAVASYQQALALYKLLQDSSGIAQTYADLAESMHCLEEPNEVHESLQLAYKSAKKSSNNHVIDYVTDVIEKIKNGKHAALEYINTFHS